MYPTCIYLIALDGQVISDFERDDLHREVYRTQGKLTSCFGYDAMGRKAWQYASSVPAEKLSKVTNPNVPTRVLLNDYRNAVQRQYEYDPAGELIRTLDQLRGEIRYEYEANGQLHGRETGKLMTSEEFRYDPAANRLNFGTSQFDKVKDNRLRNWQNNEYRYDPWGNLIEKRSGQRQVQYFKYDCENRLVASETLVQGRLHSKGRYQYDSLGRRIGKSAEQDGQVQEKRFLWQGLRMLQELTPERDSLYLYEPGSYAPLARVDRTEGEAQQRYYYHTDQIGTPLEMTDGEGRIVWQATYKAWGSIETLAVAEVEQNLRFQGQYFDGETGLHYNTFRYYDPEIGRFITQDPIGLDGGFNLYRYAPSPIGWIDSLGLNCGESRLYRGVSAKHPELENAKNGVVKPANPHADLTPEQHADGGLTGQSQYVSWTPNRELALGHANKDGPGGILLSVPVGAPPQGASWSWGWTHINDWGEVEMLQLGTRSDVTVNPF
ncbi:RHS domain-containing protein [Pseudomonas eucalypticola]|uniref:RHS domain-containing protein n=1 Tax=Pseudomonas eucalypticola TaxID=2599595 RepID=A0A7D5H4Q9_9PSED|nr:RHS domain-containing protein [Pseudomonas eucalypticola]